MAAARSSSCKTFPHSLSGLLGGEDHRSFSQVAIVDHMKQNIGGIGTVG